MLIECFTLLLVVEFPSVVSIPSVPPGGTTVPLVAPLGVPSDGVAVLDKARPKKKNRYP